MPCGRLIGEASILRKVSLSAHIAVDTSVSPARTHMANWLAMCVCVYH